jgi:HJR/Mrr/RecB family endonuclease
MRTTGLPINFWVFLFVALVGVPILTGNFVLGVCIGGICLFVIANAIVVHQNATQARNLAEHLASENAARALTSCAEVLVLAPLYDNTLIRSEFLLMQHAPELIVRRRQLTTTSNYGLVDDSQWSQEVEFFIDEVIDKSGGEVRNSTARLCTVRQMIDTATARFASSRVSFSPDMDPIEYEQMVADSLTDLGWQTRLTKASGDQGIDVIAEMRGKRVVIQCKRYASSIGNSAVQEAFAGKSFESAEYAAVVSNAEFTRSARQLADTTQVMLLHHDELSKLEVQIFGTVAISAAAAKDAASSGAALLYMTPVCYEQAVADGLRNLGWLTRLKKTNEDHYADVIAEMRGKRVMIQCWGFMWPSIPSPQHLEKIKSLERADHFAIISNAQLQPSEIDLAKSRGVVLLGHDNLTQLEARTFGTRGQQSAVIADAA